jgi:hypothetical protein
VVTVAHEIEAPRFCRGEGKTFDPTGVQPNRSAASRSLAASASQAATGASVLTEDRVTKGSRSVIPGVPEKRTEMLAVAEPVVAEQWYPPNQTSRWILGLGIDSS